MPAWNDSSTKGRVDLASLLDATSMEHLIDLVALGALVSFGTSKDGGALSVHVRCGDVKNREWFRSDEELHDWLSEGVTALREVESRGPSNVKPLRGA